MSFFSCLLTFRDLASSSTVSFSFPENSQLVSFCNILTAAFKFVRYKIYSLFLTFGCTVSVVHCAYSVGFFFLIMSFSLSSCSSICFVLSDKFLMYLRSLNMAACCCNPLFFLSIHCRFSVPANTLFFFPQARRCYKHCSILFIHLPTGHQCYQTFVICSFLSLLE